MFRIGPLEMMMILVLIGMQSMLTEALENTVAVVGSEANLICQTHSRNCNTVTWRVFSGSSNPVTIFRDNSGIINVDRNRYSVNNSSGCALVIKNVQLTDAGSFTCEHIGPDKSTVYETAFFITLRSLPSCGVNATDGSAVEGDGVQLTCEVTFNGTNNALVTWKDLENVPKSVQIQKTVKLSHSVTAIRPEIPSYDCITTFELPKGIDHLASNIPTAPPCRTNHIKLLYPVKTVTLSPGGSIHLPDSPITCSSDGYPSPTFKWQITREIVGENESWKDLSGETSEIFSPNTETGNYYRCVASNTVRGQPHVAVSNQFQVNAETRSVVGTVVGIVFGLVGLVIIVLAVYFLYFGVRKKEELDKPDNDYVNIGDVDRSRTATTDATTEGNESAYASLEDRQPEQHQYESLNTRRNNR